MRAIFFLVMSASLSFSTEAAIESYGDSVTAGMLSSTQITKHPSLGEINQLMTDLVTWKLTGNKNLQKKLEPRELAWPTKLAGLLGEDRVSNVAVSGAKTAALSAQVTNLNVINATDDAFFLMGHNDLCKNTATPEVIAASFKSYYNNALAEWDRKHQGATAHLLPVGDIPKVYAVLDGYQWNNETSRITCNDNWSKFFPYCRFFFNLHEKGELDAFLTPRLVAMNEALEELAEEWDAKSTRNHYRMLPNVHDIPYAPRHFAADCYHLSEEGQSDLAKSIQLEM